MRPLIRTAVLSGAMLAVSAPIHVAAPAAASSSALERYDREVTLPAGTVLRVRVTRGFGSDFSRVEDPVTATLARGIVIDGRTVLPAGSRVSGYVSDARRAGKVKGRARVAVRFTRIVDAESEAYSINTRPWVAVAPATKKKDAMTIGIPAAGGAVVGALVGGKKGAGIGAAAGGGAGTAVVLSTRGREVRIGRGAILAVRLRQPLTVRVEN